MGNLRTIYTIGHSNRAFEDFLALLQEYEIAVLADIRTVPKSRTYPYFNTEELAQTLPAAGIEYVHTAKLGGLRKGKKGAPSRNDAWENSSFRNYADYAETESFREGLDELISIAHTKRTAYMCSEAVWWRCHRRIVTDYMLTLGWKVLHIMAPHKTTEATLDPKAVVTKEGRHPNEIEIIYPAEQQSLGL
jgi:uncharacterized protein (DUF488 family)